MLYEIIQSFLLGFAITAVPGAVLFEVIRRCLLANLSVIKFLFGNFSGMALILVIAFLGIDIISTGIAADFLFALSGALLIYLGVSAIRQNPTFNFEGASQKSAFITGFVLAAANPLSILFWISLTGKYLKESQSALITSLLVLSVVCGSIFLFFLVLLTVRSIKKPLNIKHMKYLSVVFGSVICAYGVVTLLKIYQ